MVSRQEEVEGQPFQDPIGRWHNPNGSFMDDEEYEAAVKDGLIIPGVARADPPRHRTTTPPPAPKRTPRRTHETEEDESNPLEAAIRQFYVLHSQMGEAHAHMGECLETIVDELKRTLEPVMALANQFKSPARAAAKVSAIEPRKGGRGAVRSDTDKRLARNRPEPPEDPDEEPDEEQDEE